MLEVPLGRLYRDGAFAIDTEVPSDDPMWAGLDPGWAGPVEAHFRLSVAGSGQIVARGRVRGLLAQHCRRCLEPLERTFDEEMTLVFVEEEETETDDGSPGDLHVIRGTDSELDLSGPIREEVFLAIEPYVVCDPECKGICPGCGTNLNEGACACRGEELDPRWDALRKLKEK
jgi:uncharacterized protein